MQLHGWTQQAVAGSTVGTVTEQQDPQRAVLLTQLACLQQPLAHERRGTMAYQYTTLQQRCKGACQPLRSTWLPSRRPALPSPGVSVPVEHCWLRSATSRRCTAPAGSEDLQRVAQPRHTQGRPSVAIEDTCRSSCQQTACHPWTWLPAEHRWYGLDVRQRARTCSP